MVFCFVFQPYSIDVMDETMRIIATITPYGFADPESGSTLDVRFGRGAANSKLVQENLARLCYELVDGFRMGCAVVSDGGCPTFVATIDDEDDGEVLLVDISDNGAGGYRAVVYEGDGDYSVYAIVRHQSGYELIEE